ncbi:MAG: hypothetical protein AABW81_01665 [Nanoarchaeota archaeon]
MIKQWIKYAPKGRDTKYDTKMHLRNMCKFPDLNPDINIIVIKKIDYADDEYLIDGFKVEGRENMKPEEIRDGIFFYAEESKKSKIEKILTKILG